MGAVSIEIPAGSDAANVVSSFDIQTIAISALEGLANSASVSSLSYTNPGSSINCKVILDLAPIEIPSSGTITIDKEMELYQITVPSGASGKRIEWNIISSSFLSSFTLTDNLGITFAPSGDSLAIVPLYQEGLTRCW